MTHYSMHTVVHCSYTICLCTRAAVVMHFVHSTMIITAIGYNEVRIIQGKWASPADLVLTAVECTSVPLHLTKPFLLQINNKTLDTNGYCQRPVFSLGVSQHA